jgi:carbon monoxide dehydrogenase subunit G
MELSYTFTVDVGIEQAWDVLTDVERLSPCVPGFLLTEAGEEEFRGVMKVKVGAVAASYDSKLRFVERDRNSYRAVIRAGGKEMRGQGNVSATIVSTLEPADGATRASIAADLVVTGRVAQFGRGILVDVSNRLLQQFVACLETTILAREEER